MRLHLGWVERWPSSIKLLLPMLVSGFMWALCSPGLVRLGIIPAPVSRGHLWEQAALLGLTSFLSWKFLLLALCVLYLVNNYVYTGESSFWRFVNTTGSNLLGPLRRFPLRIGKVDFSPLLVIGLVLAAAHFAAEGLSRLFQCLPL